MSSMRSIPLAYGMHTQNFSFADDQFEIIARDLHTKTPLSDAQISSAFDSPIESPAIDDLFSPDQSVLIVVSDATRATGSAQIVNILVRRLIQLGISQTRLAIIFATGIHRLVTVYSYRTKERK